MLLDPELDSDQKRLKLISGLLGQRKADLKAWHDDIRRRRDRYFLQHYSKREQEEDEERTYLAHEMRLVDTARALLMREPVKIHCYREADTSQTQKESDKLEAWLRGLLLLQKRRLRKDPLSLFALTMLRDGQGVLQAYWDVSLDSRYNVKTGDFEGGAGLSEIPIVIKNRDPLHIFPQEGSSVGRWKWIMAAEMIPILDVEQEWNKEIEAGRGKDYQYKLKNRVEVIDVWSREIHPKTGRQVIVNAVVTPKEVLKAPSEMENYRDLPFEIAYCIPTDAEDWTRKGLPITAAIEKILPQLASGKNALMSMVKFLSNLQLYTSGPGSPPEFGAGWGEVPHLQENQKIETVKWPGAPPDLYAIDRMLEAEVEAGGMGAPVMGKPPASPSGYALSLRGEAGTLKMVEPARSFSDAIMNTLQNVCSLAAGYAPDDDMTVLGQLHGETGVFTLKGADCEGFFIEVETSAKFPDDKARDRAIGMQLAVAPKPILDMRTILEEFMHFENVDQIKRRIMVEMAEQHPDLMRYLLVKALEEAGDPNAVAVLTGQAPGQPSVAQPPRGMPVEGVPTQVMPQEPQGAMRSQEMGLQPKGRMFAEEEPLSRSWPGI